MPAGAGSATGEWRLVLFVAAEVTGWGRTYDANSQTQPWGQAQAVGSWHAFTFIAARWCCARPGVDPALNYTDEQWIQARPRR